MDCFNLLQYGGATFTNALVFCVSIAVVGFIAVALPAAIIPAQLSMTAVGTLKNSNVPKATLITALFTHAAVVLVDAAQSEEINRPFTASVAASTVDIAAVALAIAISTIICTTARTVLNGMINFVAVNCVIMQYTTASVDDRKRCATLCISLLAAVVFSVGVGGFEVPGLELTKGG